VVQEFVASRISRFGLTRTDWTSVDVEDLRIRQCIGAFGNLPTEFSSNRQTYIAG